MLELAHRNCCLASCLSLLTCACTGAEPAPIHGEPPPVVPSNSRPPPPESAAPPPSASPTSAGRREFEAGTLPGALELASSYALEHLHQDMNVYTTRRYDMDLRLAIEADGRAELSLRGSLALRSAELSPDGAGTSTPERELDIDERWSGAARLLDGDLVVRFDTSTAYQPPLAVDIEWVCSPTSVTLAGQGASLDAWQCATAQTNTQPSGPAHALLVYLQVPLTLAASREHLHVDALARGGADDRSSLSSASHSRAPRPSRL